MNHELVMLRGALRMKKSATRLTKVVNRMALKSFSTEKYRNGTMGQIQDICHYTEMRDKHLNFYSSVKQALSTTPKGYRALICEVYLKRTNKQNLCQRYKVSLSTLYRKLALARKSFKRQLDSIGCDQQWLIEQYGDICWVRDLLASGNQGGWGC